MNARLDLVAAPEQLGQAERDRLAAALSAGLAALRGPLRIWHGPRAAATGRPRGTWFSGTRLPTFPDAGGLFRLVEDTATPALPVPGEETRSGLGLLGPRPAGRVLVLAGWPAVIRLGWLAALAAEPAVDAIVLFLHPLPAATAEKLLRRRLDALGASRLIAERAGGRADPQLTRALASAARLQVRLAAGETALLRARLYVASSAEQAPLLEATAAGLAGLLAAGSPGARLAGLPFEQRPGWVGLTGSRAAAGRPGPGGRWRILDATCAGLAVPLPAPAFLAPADEPEIGVDPATGARVGLDRFALVNPARLVVGSSGAGKSFAAKLEVSRWLDRGAAVLVVDPEGEFAALAAARGGLRVPGGVDPVAVAADARLPVEAAVDLLAAGVAALLGLRLSAGDVALLDAALFRLRERAVARPGTPVGLPELCRAVAALARRAPFTGSDLAGRLAPASAGRLARQLRVDPALAAPPPLVVADLSGTPGPLRPAVTAGLLGWAWVQAVAGERPGRPRLVVLDEAHLLLGDAHTAGLLAGFARRARKYGVGLEVVTQRLADFLADPAGRVVLDCAATRLLLGVGEPERSELARALGLSGGEVELLAGERPGLGLLTCPRGRLPVQIAASAEEHPLAAAGPSGGWRPE